MLKLLKLLECIPYKYESTGNINKRVKQHWNSTFGQLMKLHADGYIDCEEITLNGGTQMYIWKRRKDIRTSSITKKINMDKPLTDEDYQFIVDKAKELNNLNKLDEQSE